MTLAHARREAEGLPDKGFYPIWMHSVREGVREAVIRGWFRRGHLRWKKRNGVIVVLTDDVHYRADLWRTKKRPYRCRVRRN